MKTTLITILLTIITLGCFSQPKDYYCRNGIINPKTRSSAQYFCKVMIPDLVSIQNVNHKLTDKFPFKKDGSSPNGEVVDMVVLDDPDIIYTIVSTIFKKYSLEIFSTEEYRKNRHLRISSDISIMIDFDSTTGELLEVAFSFFARDGHLASYLPIEAYIEIEKEIRKKVKAKVNEEGKTRIFCRQFFRFVTKPKVIDSK